MSWLSSASFVLWILVFCFIYFHYQDESRKSADLEKFDLRFTSNKDLDTATRLKQPITLLSFANNCPRVFDSFLMLPRPSLCMHSSNNCSPTFMLEGSVVNDAPVLAPKCYSMNNPVNLCNSDVWNST